MIAMPQTKFTHWIENAYIDWQKQEGGRRSVTEFAELLGFPQPTVTNWMNGKRSPSPDNAFQIALKLKTLEVYDALELERPDEDLFWVQANWELLDDGQKARVVEMMQEVKTQEDAKEAKARKVKAART